MREFYQKNKFLILVIFFALVFRMGILFFTSHFSAFNFPDEASYDNFGWLLAQKWLGGGDFNIIKETSHIQIGYYYFVAAIYFIFGHEPIMVSLVNIILGILAGLLLYFLSREIFSEKTAKIVLILSLFWPSIAFWSTQNLKDTLLLFLMAALALLFLKILNRAHNSLCATVYLLGFLICSVALLSMRAYTFLLFAGSLALGYLIIGFRKFNKRAVFAGILLIVLLSSVVLFLSQFKNLQWNYLTKINLNTLDFIRKSTVLGGSSFGQNIEYRSWGDVLAFLPMGLAYAIFSPFPWQFKEGGLFKLAVPETILWYLVLFFLIYGIYLAIRSKKLEGWSFIIFIVIAFLTFALFQGNIGSLFRQRAQVWFFGFIFAGYGFSAFLDSKNYCFKRGLDIFLSIIGLILTSPIFLIVSLFILLDDGRPIFYRSERVGLNNKKFKMYKFRTMKINRDDIPDFEYTPENDPRVTKIGKFLRRFTLDEVPQFINVLKGEMSMVGPRPSFPFRFLDNPVKYKKRHSMKPGLTGWQQVNGRNTLEWGKIIELDNFYVAHWSIGLDFKIILKTISVVLSGKGQYASENLYKDAAKSFKEYVDKSEAN